MAAACVDVLHVSICLTIWLKENRVKENQVEKKISRILRLSRLNQSLET
jgi:hypothetical protein